MHLLAVVLSVMRNTFQLIIFLVTVNLGIAQSVYFVRKDATGANNGTSWENAFTDLQNALAVAQTGSQIWVASGQYLPTPSTDRDISFQLKEGVGLYGGFDGTELTLNARNPAVNASILSGAIGDSTANDNSYHVLRAKGVSAATTIDGFIIEHGQAVAGMTGGNNNYGGGMLVSPQLGIPLTAPVIRNCIFRFNVAQSGGAFASLGSAAFNIEPHLVGCRFEQNAASLNGGAILRSGWSADHLFPSLDSCMFQGNTAALQGGAIYFDDCVPDFLIDNCIFLNDSSYSGGAVTVNIDVGEGHFRVRNSSFEGNQATSSGGALEVIYSSTSGSYELAIEHTDFAHNQALINQGGAIALAAVTAQPLGATISHSYFYRNISKSDGAGIFYSIFYPNSKGYLHLSENCFIENKRTNSNVGGCIGILGGPVYPNNNDEFNIEAQNCIFVRNTSVYGLPAPNRSRMKGDFINCTFFLNGNYPFLKGWRPGFNGIDSFSIARFENCIIWEPQQTDLGLLFYNNNPYDYSVHDYQLNHCVISHPDCEYEGVNICEDGVIHSEWPDFADTIGCEDFTLQFGSPAINRGSNFIINNAMIETDFAGLPRIYCDTVDIGVYESQVGCISTSFEPLSHNLTVCQIGSIQGFLCLKVDGLTAEATLQIFDSRGQEVFYTNMKPSLVAEPLLIEVNVDLSPGIYLVLASDRRNKKMTTCKALKL